MAIKKEVYIFLQITILTSLGYQKIPVQGHF